MTKILESPLCMFFNTKSWRLSETAKVGYIGVVCVYSCNENEKMTVHGQTGIVPDTSG